MRGFIRLSLSEDESIYVRAKEVVAAYDETEGDTCVMLQNRSSLRVTERASFVAQLLAAEAEE